MKRLGGLAALAPTVVVLFLGSTPEPISPAATVFVQGVVFGLAAVLALERRTLLGDAVACLLLTLAVAAFSLGLPFVVTAGILVLLSPGGMRRLWVVAIPAILYLAWFVWARQFDEHTQSLANILLLPTFAADSLASGAGALAGLSTNLTGSGRADAGWGRIIVVPVLVGVALGIRRRGVSPPMLAFIAFLAVLWTVGVLNTGFLRTPGEPRYGYPVAIGIVLVLGEAFREMRMTRSIFIALLAFTIFAVPGNLAELRKLGAANRVQSGDVRAKLAVIELERERIRPGLSGGRTLPVRTGAYLNAADRYGSLAFSLPELRRQPAATRRHADQLLGQILRPRVVPTGRTPVSGCRTLSSATGPVVFSLPRAGVLPRSQTPAPVRLRRFGDHFTVQAGMLLPNRSGALGNPSDSATDPWFVMVGARRPVTVCPLTPTAAR